jgi:UDP-N-acetylmuramoyl-L-alanyl-D-glutamate--2,6-diaminopimelate ligase
MTKPVGIDLREVLNGCEFFGGDPQPVTSCCGDSRQVKPGDLFTALLGKDHDGHDYAREAVERGASAVLAERPMPIGVPTCIVEDTRQAYGRICHALAGNPTQTMQVAGVTGTYGKTTTSLLLAAILEANQHSVGILSSMGYCDGDRVNTDVMTTPTSPELARWLCAAQSNGCDHAVVEASSEGLAEHRLAGTELDLAIITNIRKAHLDKHGSVLNYRRIKARLTEHLKSTGVAVMNADDPVSQSFLTKVKRPLITFGMHSAAEVTASVLESHHGQQTILLTAGSDSIPVQTRIIGTQHVYNCLAAAAAGLVWGFDLTTIAKGLETVDLLPGRMECQSSLQSFATYIDTGVTSDSLAATLQSLRRVTPGRLMCVFSAPYQGDSLDRPLLGRVVEKYADYGVITRSDPRDEKPLETAHDILDGYDRPSQAHLLPDRARAIGWTLSEAQEGDTVLIAGRGNEQFELEGGEQAVLDDRQITRFFLDELDKKEESKRRVA